MPDYSYLQRNPREYLQKFGVEDEREKAERILAQCTDKPIRRIKTAADIPRPKGWLLSDGGSRERELSSLEKRDAILELLAHGPLTKAAIVKALGYGLPDDRRNLHSLTRMKIDGRIAHRKKTVIPGRKGKVIMLWSLAE